MINIEALRFKYLEEQVILDNLNLKIRENQFVLIKGRSGIGKSTLLSCLVGLLEPCEGTIEVHNNKINGMSENEKNFLRKKYISFLPQENSLINSLTILDNVCIPKLLDPKEKDWNQIITEARTLIDRVGLKNKKYKKPSELSGGEQRRAEIARLILSKTPIIVMDEPTKGMDDECVSFFNKMMKELKQDNRTIIVSTHDDRVVSDDVDSIYVMKNGRLY